MRAYRSDFRHDDRDPLRPELRAQLVELLAVWSEQLAADATCDRYALHSLAEAIATFPSTNLLTPLRSLLSADLNRWRAEKEQFQSSIERGERPDPASGARMSYAYRYGQNMLSLATGRNADIAEEERDQEETLVSHEMTDAVIDVLCEFILDYEFGEDAARVIATLRPDPITEIGSPRRFMSYDVRVVSERREARLQRGAEADGPIAERFLDAIDQLRSEGTSEALQHAIKLRDYPLDVRGGRESESEDMETSTQTRWGVVAGICRRPWVRAALIIWAVFGAYDTFVSQLLPSGAAERFPRLYDLAVMTSGFMPGWVWLLVLAAIFVAASIEYAHRKGGVSRSTVENLTLTGKRTAWGQEWHELRSDRRDFWSLANGAYANSSRGAGEYSTLAEMILSAPFPKDLPLPNGGDFPQWVWSEGDFKDGTARKLNQFVSNIFPARTPPGQYGCPLLVASDERRLDDLRAELAKFWDKWGRHDQLETVIAEQDVGEILKSCAVEIELLTYLELARARWSQSQASGKFGLFRLGRRNEEMGYGTG